MIVPPLCRHCNEPLKLTVLERNRDGSPYWVHEHRLYRCQSSKVVYGHNAAHPDIPCESLGPINRCACLL